MNYKRFISILLVFALILVFPTSVLANKGFNKKEAWKWKFESSAASTKESQYVENIKVKNWLKWTNNTGEMKKFTSYVDTKVIIRYKDGSHSGLMYTNTNYFSGSNETIEDIYIPDGATLYIYQG